MYLHFIHFCHGSSTGLAESISFNVSSAIPPSPIPPTASMDSYTTKPTRHNAAKTTRRGAKKGSSAQPLGGASSTVAVEAGVRGSGRSGRKRVKTNGVAVSIIESAKDPEQGADISMLPPSDK